MHLFMQYIKISSIKTSFKQKTLLRYNLSLKIARNKKEIHIVNVFFFNYLKYCFNLPLL